MVSLKQPPHGEGRVRLVRLTGVITVGAAGAVGSATADGYATVAKTAAEVGRYTVTLDRKYRSIRVLGVSLEGPADAALGNAAGNLMSARNVATQTFDVQCSLASTGADTETTSGNKIHWAVEVQE